MTQTDEQPPADEQCLSEDQILACDDHRIERVDVPEWGGHLYVRIVSGAELDAFQQGCQKGRGPNQRINMLNFRARFVQLVACDKDEKPLFSKGRVDALGRKSARALDRVFTIGQNLNGITDEEFEDMVGNFRGGPTGGSG